MPPDLPRPPLPTGGTDESTDKNQDEYLPTFAPANCQQQGRREEQKQKLELELELELEQQVQVQSYPGLDVLALFVPRSLFLSSLTTPHLSSMSL
ncbi:uncharacterized protein CTRU02_201904 [Colletotrichum truncatum]|uniref:Uncharacterized protein n=1 Tax=Colletotrichum truncatum TaxID=5467 RepID=A0ACC3ZJB4_COLTU|nr:uncharacterized protein CTRU02_07016 [Colletotrichum truncatum]KAF6791831.1 hypothetical protein CTRU02_07016 [Colletotrichum truncatum]